jgi:A/G-specific adenine glycosylase
LWSLPEHGGTASLNTLTAGWPGTGRWLPTVQHALTHLDWTLHPLLWHWPDEVALSAPALEHAGAGLSGRWVSPLQALAMGLPAPVRKLLLAPTTR